MTGAKGFPWFGKALAASVAAAGLLLCLTSWPTVALAQHASESQPRISIGTGSPTGIYYIAGNAICRLIDRQNKRNASDSTRLRMECAAPATPGSIYNIGQIREHNFNFGLVQSDWQYNAYRGSSRFKDQPFGDLRAVMSLHPEALQILAGKGTGISTFAGLKGKRVSIGEPGSGTRATFEVLMQAESVDTGYFSRTGGLPQGDQNKELCDGNLDAVTYSIGIPSAPVRDAVERCGASILDLDTPETRTMVSRNLYYAMTTIKQGTYDTIEHDVTTFGVMATLVTQADTPDDVVYELVRTVFEGLDDLRAMHPAFANLDPHQMARAGLSAPIHPGALRYYTEKNLISPGIF